MTMDAKTRVELTIRHQEVDRVAKGELVLDDQVLSAHYNIPEVQFEHRWDFAKELSLDLITHFPRYIRDQGLPTMDLNLPDLKQWAVHTDLFHFYVLDGAFETGLAHFGFGDFCAMVMTEDEELEDFVHHMERINMESIRKLADQGANGILLADDVAIQQGMILRPEQFKDAFLASMERQVDLIRKLDLIPFFHSDGNYLAIADDLVNAGFSGLHCLDKMCGVTLDALRRTEKNCASGVIWTCTTWRKPNIRRVWNKSSTTSSKTPDSKASFWERTAGCSRGWTFRLCERSIKKRTQEKTGEPPVFLCPL